MILNRIIMIGGILVRNYPNLKFKKIKSIFLLLLIAIILGILYFNYTIANHYSEICIQKSKQISGKAISYSISNLSCSDKLETSDFITINYNKDNQITSIESNTSQINKVQSEIINNINSFFESKSQSKFSISLGTLTGNTFLNGKGPSIAFRFTQTCSPKVSLTSNFSSAGINQTLHQIYAHIEIEVYSVSPKKSKPVQFEFDYLIAETVVVGEIPNTYISLP